MTVLVDTLCGVRYRGVQEAVVKGWLRTEPKLTAPTDYAVVYKLAYDIADAMAAIHSLNIMHGVGHHTVPSGFPDPLLLHFIQPSFHVDLSLPPYINVAEADALSSCPQLMDSQ